MSIKKDPTNKKRPAWISWLPYLALPILVYFGNVELQSYLGRQAIENTGLTINGFEDALALATKENKLVLADMSAVWCPTCRKLDQEVFANEQVKAAIEGKYIFSRIEYESKEGEAFMQKYQISGFPTVLIIDAKGNKLKKLPLTFSPETFISQL